jgi:hypothetical protein
MPFDFTTAIAKLELASGTDRPDLDALRARYPDMGFVFDLLEDTLTENERVFIDYRDERREVEREYQQHIEELEARIHDLRLTLDQVRVLTADAEINQIIEDAL